MKGQGTRKTTAARPPWSRQSSRKRLSPPAADSSFPVVGLGASAGGLDAFRRLLAALPAGTGMAFILIQHLDPTHASMMVDLLAGHTPMKVQQVSDGMPFVREHVYLIPPGTYRKLLFLLRETGGSNPSSSSGESAANCVRSCEHSWRPRVQ
jgi:two-component system, chemotaxis family, CheB/CheR fusion protein